MGNINRGKTAYDLLESFPSIHHIIKAILSSIFSHTSSGHALRVGLMDQDIKRTVSRVCEVLLYGFENRFEHVCGQAAGVGVVAGAMVAVEEVQCTRDRINEAVAGAMGERMRASFDVQCA